MTVDAKLIKNDTLTALVSPISGAVLSLSDHQGRDILRPFPECSYGPSGSDAMPILETSCFPLIPLAGRVANSGFRFQGKEYSLSPNSTIDPSYIHGDGWLAEWCVIDHRTDTLTLTYDHHDENSPFIYHAQQNFQLSNRHLGMTISVKNTGPTPLPYGIGFHPYFPRTPDLSVTFKSQYFWHNDTRTIAHHYEPTPNAFQFGSTRPLPEALLDNCFSGWDGKARFDWPKRELSLSLSCDPVFEHCQIYAPKGADFFCLEPLSHVPNAHNMTEAWGLKTLAPGETLSGCVNLSVATTNVT